MPYPEDNPEFSKSFMHSDARLRRVNALGRTHQIPKHWSEQLPVKSRKLTDFCCLLTLLIFLIFMLTTTFYIFWKSDSRSMYELLDSSGNNCGEGAAKDFPLLYMQSFSAPFRSVCVKECPKFDYNQIKYNSTGSMREPNGDDEQYSQDFINASVPLHFVEFDLKYSGASATHTLHMSDEEIFGFDEGFANEYFTEQNWENYLKHREPLECLPNEQVSSCKYKKNSFWVYDTYEFLGLICVPVQPKTSLQFYRISSQINHGMVGDILDSKMLFLYVMLISLGLSLAFLVFTRFCGAFVMWVLKIATILLLILSGILLLVTYYYEGPLHEKASHLKIKYLSFVLSHKILFHVLAIGLILLGIFLIYVVVSRRKEIGTALPLLEIAAKCSLSNILLIVLSVVTLVLQVCVFFFEIYVFARILVMGEGKRESRQGSPFVIHSLTFSKVFCMIVHAVGTYWLLIFLNNFNDFITAAISVNFYFGTQLKNINIFCHSLGHHSGSVAWTVILLPVYIIKFIFFPFKWLFTTERPNTVQKKVNSFCNACCSCYEFLFDSICENYMAITYTGSDDFFIATRRYFYLTQKYLDEHQTATFLSFLYNLLGRLLISILGGYCGILIYRSDLEMQQNIKYVGVIFFLCFFISFMIGSLFINLFSTAYDTMVVCYLLEYNLYEQLDSQYEMKANEEIRECLKGTINPDTKSYIRLLNK